MARWDADGQHRHAPLIRTGVSTTLQAVPYLPDPYSVFDGWTLDPEHLLIATGVAVLAIVLLYLLWGELRHRARRYGGDDRTAVVMLVAVFALIIAISPNIVPMEVGVILLLAAFAAIYKPATVVKLFGGPNIRWRALHEGRELQVIVAERGGPASVADDEEINLRVAALGDLESPETVEYLRLLRMVLLADPEAPGISLKRAQLADADAALRASLAARPAWERELQKRMVAAGAESAATWTVP
jgi:hypothetical protein